MPGAAAAVGREDAARRAADRIAGLSRRADPRGPIGSVPAGPGKTSGRRRTEAEVRPQQASRGGCGRFDATLRAWKKSTLRPSPAAMPAPRSRARQVRKSRPNPNRKASPAPSSAICRPSRSRSRMPSARSSRRPARPCPARPRSPDESTGPSPRTRWQTCTRFTRKRAWPHPGSWVCASFRSRRSSARPSPAPPNEAAISSRCDSSAARTGRRDGSGFCWRTSVSRPCRRSIS